MAGAGEVGERNVMDAVHAEEGMNAVMFDEPIDPPGPSKEEIKNLQQWEKNLFSPPQKK